MTTLTGIELSKKVAELYGIPESMDPRCEHYQDMGIGQDKFYLHEDSARCFELAHEHGLCISFANQWIRLGWETMEFEGDSIQAYRTAILQCLVDMKENG